MDDVGIALALLFVVLLGGPVVLQLLGPPRKRRLTLKASMVVIAALAVDFAALAQARRLSPILVSLAVCGLYAILPVFFARYAPRRLDAVLAVAWVILLLAALSIVSLQAARRAY